VEGLSHLGIRSLPVLETLPLERVCYQLSHTDGHLTPPREIRPLYSRKAANISRKNRKTVQENRRLSGSPFTAWGAASEPVFCFRRRHYALILFVLFSSLAQKRRREGEKRESLRLRVAESVHFLNNFFILTILSSFCLLLPRFIISHRLFKSPETFQASTGRNGNHVEI
jgi:hypothetical protein